ncbi:MAG TPA: hypothetical protein VLZ81_05475 [Blastocatellia bacterium]|nr:hypothetical protein [Blastocatellia bacterium]
MTGTAPGASGRGSGIRSDLVPVLASAAAALCSVAFFKVWVVFTVDMGGPADVGLGGAALAKEISGAIPWIYATPAGLILILLLSFLRLLANNRVTGRTFSGALVVVSLVLALWPVNAIAHIYTRLRANSSSPTMALGGWWWAYCFGLAVIIAVGIAEFLITIRTVKSAK